MKVVINETQYFQVLTESKRNEVESVLSDTKNFTRKIMSDVREQFGMDFTFAATWGSVIGGFTKPINDYLHGLHPELTDSQLSLIIFGVILTFFSSNTDKLKQALKIIKDKKLVTYFNQALMKSYDLRDSFFSFLESLNITVSNVSNMISYAFLIPITPLIYNVATMDLTSDQIDLLVKGISHWGATIVSSKILYRIVKNMINRFKTKV